MHISRRDDHSVKTFLKRTVAAQTHMWTAMAAVLGLLVLTPVAYKSGPWHFWGTAVFGVTAVLVFSISALYHFLHDGYQISDVLANRFEMLDQWSIYLFIAGTYTPFLINAVKSPWKEILMVSVWSMAIIGIAYTALRSRLPEWAQSRAVYTAMFVLMGWTLLIRVGEIYSNLSALAMTFFVAGSLAYSVGAIVYATQKPKLIVGFFGFHELWHVFVTLGFVFHFAMIGSFYL
jgi:hemolysin III